LPKAPTGYGYNRQESISA